MSLVMYNPRMKTSQLFFFAAFSLFAGEDKPPEKRVIILFGAPGSGKGTQALRLSQEFSIPHISTGDLFRENIRKGTEIGKQVKSIIDAGKLVSDEIVLAMLQERVGRSDTAKGYILDGFPRRLSQAVALDRELARDPHTCVIPINLKVADEIVIERITGRLTCPNGHTAHRIYQPPKVEGVCDVCGEPLSQRTDDQEEVVVARLRHYYDETAPVIQYYEGKGNMTTVDGAEPPDRVFAKIKSIIKAACS
jgi:adenylate kinase